MKISNLTEELYYQPHSDSESDQVQDLMDPCILFWAPSEVREDLEEILWRMYYALHIRRSALMGTQPSEIGVSNLRSNHSGEDTVNRKFTRCSPTPEEVVST